MSWLQDLGDHFSRAFLENDRYLAYLKGFGVTL